MKCSCLLAGRGVDGAVATSCAPTARGSPRGQIIRVSARRQCAAHDGAPTSVSRTVLGSESINRVGARTRAATPRISSVRAASIRPGIGAEVPRNSGGETGEKRVTRRGAAEPAARSRHPPEDQTRRTAAGSPVERGRKLSATRGRWSREARSRRDRRPDTAAGKFRSRIFLSEAPAVRCSLPPTCHRRAGTNPHSNSRAPWRRGRRRWSLFSRLFSSRSRTGPAHTPAPRRCDVRPRPASVRW